MMTVPNIHRARSLSAGARGRVSLLAALAVVGLACPQSPERTYVEVRVTIDESVTATQLYLVTTCDVQVRSSEIVAPFYLPCRENRVPREVGTFQWVSQAQSGTLQFVVSIMDANNVVVGRAESEVIPVAPGKAPIKIAMVVQSVLPAPGNDAGSNGGAGLDGAADARADSGALGTDVSVGDVVPAADASIDAIPDELVDAGANTDAEPID